MKMETRQLSDLICIQNKKKGKMSRPNKRIKDNYFKVKAICEKINNLLDQGYLIFDREGEKVDDRWRFKFEEPPWEKLDEDYVWSHEITLQVSENCIYGYFDPDETWKETKIEWEKWRACRPTDLVKIC